MLVKLVKQQEFSGHPPPPNIYTKENNKQLSDEENQQFLEYHWKDLNKINY